MRHQVDHNGGDGEQKPDATRNPPVRRATVSNSIKKGRYARAPWPEPSPFAHLLTSYAFEQRTSQHPRPLNAREIGERIGYSRITVNNWMTHGVEPPLDTMLDVIAKLGIPVARLIQAYETAMSSSGIEQPPTMPTMPTMPPMPTTPTTPTTSAPQQQTAAITRPETTRPDAPAARPDEQQRWEQSLRTTEQTLRDAGLTDTDVHRVISHMRRTAAGEDPLRQRAREEFHDEQFHDEQFHDAQRGQSQQRGHPGQQAAEPAEPTGGTTTPTNHEPHDR